MRQSLREIMGAMRQVENPDRRGPVIYLGLERVESELVGWVWVRYFTPRALGRHLRHRAFLVLVSGQYPRNDSGRGSN